MSDLGAFSLWELFQGEVDSQMRSFTDELLALERSDAPAAHLAAAMRAAHSIKGAARLVQLDAGVRLAHVMEDCLVAAQESALVLTGDGVDVLLSAADLLSRLSQVREPAVPAWLEEHADSVEQLVARLGEVRAGTWIAQASPTPAAPPPTASTPVPAAPSVEPPPAPSPQHGSEASGTAPLADTRAVARHASPAVPARAVLVFEAAGQRYGLDVSEVVEVVPAVPLRPLPGTPSTVAGLCRYRGRLVPVLDVNQMLGGPPAARRYSTRIVVVRYRGRADGAEQLLGLLAERLDHGVDDAPGALTSSGVSTPDMPWLGALAATATKTTQLVSVHQLLADDLRARLFTET